MKISTLKKGDRLIKTSPVVYETLAITAITLLGMWFIPAAKTLFALLPVAYLLIERRIRKRTWGELGFKASTFWADLRANWVLFLLLGFILQPAIGLWAKAYFPEYLKHVQARLPFDSAIRWEVLLPLLAISLVGEELTYRTLIQGRLTPWLGVPAAVGLASLLFGLAHFAPGPSLVVSTDIGLIIFDSILYGVIFARRNNLWVVWLAHFLGDVFGLLVLATI